MKILSVDTSANVATAAISADDKLICEFSVNNKLTHSQTLMPIIDSILKQAETDLSEIDLIAVANGPGSFTGLRIGVSAVKGFAHAANIPVVGISTLTSMAYNLPYCPHIICPIMDARRSQVYNAVYKWNDDELTELKAPRALGIDELLDELSDYERVVFLGDGVPVHKSVITEKLGDRSSFAPLNANLQRASSLSAAAIKAYAKGKAVDGSELTPDYLRKSQAEREAEENEKRKENK